MVLKTQWRRRKLGKCWGLGRGYKRNISKFINKEKSSKVYISQDKEGCK